MPKYWWDHVHLVSPDPAKTAEFMTPMASPVFSRGVVVTTRARLAVVVPVKRPWTNRIVRSASGLHASPRASVAAAPPRAARKLIGLRP